jgi:hypothetical protein
MRARVEILKLDRRQRIRSSKKVAPLLKLDLRKTQMRLGILRCKRPRGLGNYSRGLGNPALNPRQNRGPDLLHNVPGRIERKAQCVVISAIAIDDYLVDAAPFRHGHPSGRGVPLYSFRQLRGFAYCSQGSSSAIGARATDRSLD